MTVTNAAVQPLDPPHRLDVAIDFDAPGRTVGHIGLVHSTTPDLDDAVIPIPVAVIAGSAGPTVLLAAGTHGDEYEGQALLQAFARDVDPARVRGRIIVLPALNLPAVLSATRVSPLDDGNLNRAYPGDRDGSPTFALADFIRRVLLPKCDFAFDIHSGGKATEYLPCGFMTRMSQGRNTRVQAEAMMAFGLPHTLVFDEQRENRAFDTACDQAGVVMVSTELSGAGTLTLPTLDAARDGLLRLLAHWNVLDPSGVPSGAGTQFVDINDPRASVMATREGVFVPAVNIGALVREGDVAGHLYPVDDLSVPADVIRFRMSGMVVKRRTPPLVRRGANVMSVGTPISLGDLT